MRSQMYVIIKRHDQYYLIAKSYEDDAMGKMISRARGVLEYAVNNCTKPWAAVNPEKLGKIMDVNWDIHDIETSSDIMKEFPEEFRKYRNLKNPYTRDFINYCCSNHKNDEGQMYLYIDTGECLIGGKPKMCFTRWGVFAGSHEVVSAEDYLNQKTRYIGTGTWQERMIRDKVDLETVLCWDRNVKYITENSEMLDSEELLKILTFVARQYKEDYKDPAAKSDDLDESIPVKEKYGLTEERYQQLKTRCYDEDEFVAELVEDILRRGFDVEAINKGYILDAEPFGGGEGWLIHVERLIEIGAFEDDEAAARQAEKDGIQIIPVEDLPLDFYEKFYGYIDTPENRDAICAYCAYCANYHSYHRNTFD